MSSSFKNFLQYVVILGITVLLIFLSLRGLNVAEGENKWDYLNRTWETANKGWLLMMAIIAMVSHIVRAERWRMLLVPLGYNIKLRDSFYSLMVGYLVNLVIPRGGEVSRCYNLFKLDKTPVEVSFGTVVVERIVDLFFLLLLIAVSFALESQKLIAFISTLPFSISGNSKFRILLYVIPAGIIFILVCYWILKKNKRLNQVMLKTWNGFKEGLLSVFSLKRKGLFVFYSCLIWALYFVMSYAVLRAFPTTSELGFSAVLSIFAIGAIAMAAPLPGGTGSYHVLVPQGLFFLYHIPLNDAVAFTFIFHGWQTAIFIVFGALSLFITSYLVKKNALK